MCHRLHPATESYYLWEAKEVMQHILLQVTRPNQQTKMVHSAM
jgi:hypothetical protein